MDEKKFRDRINGIVRLVSGSAPEVIGFGYCLLDKFLFLVRLGKLPPYTAPTYYSINIYTLYQKQ